MSTALSPDEAWREMRLHVEWATGFSLCFVFSDAPALSRALLQRFDDAWRFRTAPVELIEPADPTTAAQSVFAALQAHHQTAQGLLAPAWLQLAGAGSAWDAARTECLARLNEGREWLVSDYARPLVLCLPLDWQSQVAPMAPDLWHVRSYVATVQPQVQVPGGVAAVAEAGLQTVQRAVGRQQIRFAYHSPYSGAATVETHQVAPYALLYRDGYLYLDGYCYESSVAKLRRRWVRYRLDRVAGGVTLLPYPLPPTAPARPVYTIRYQLSPPAAHRQDVAEWFAQTTVQFQADGAALVTGETSDLWQARQILLRYREHCRVLEPPELIELMRESVARLAQLYAEV